MDSQASSQLPAYITSATPLSRDKRLPWTKNVAPTYAGIFLWFVFWQQAAVVTGTAGGALAQGVLWALISVALAALVCHYLFYLVPGLLGSKTGLPLYIVGTSTFGAQGGFLMPGFLMGLLQFGWLGVNTRFSSLALAERIPVPAELIMVVFGAAAAFIGIKGIQYVARVSTYLPLIPVVILLLMFFNTVGSVGSFTPATLTGGGGGLTTLGVLAAVMTYVVGFFATAGAAGVDIAQSTRHEQDVKMGGMVGIVLAILFTAGLAMLIVAGVYGNPELAARATAGNAGMNAFQLIPIVLGEGLGRWLMFALAIAAFPSACFSSFIAANSFKTTLPQVNPFISVGIGAAVSIALAVTGLAGNAVAVFEIIGASFGPICGAMMVDYALSNGVWSGPRAGFNPAGWIAWALGFLVGILPRLGIAMPAAPVAAFLVGAVVYFVCAKAGLLSRVVPIPVARR